MRTVCDFRWLILPGLLVLNTTGCSNSSSPDTTPGQSGSGVELQRIPFSELEPAIAKFKGQVVVVDFWADWCNPCKQAFPHLVELHHKYATDGLAAVSVNLDDPEDGTRQKNALQFLKDRNATFTNLAITKNEAPKDWFGQLMIDAIPCVFVYDREGTRVKRFVGGGEYPAIEKLVGELLKQK